MKKILLFLGIASSLCLGSCADSDKAGFDTPIGQEMFSIKPVEGGAVLQYKLSDARINKVKVEYTDEFGQSVYKVGDYSIDTLLLDGFNVAHTNVPVKVSFIDRNSHESETQMMNFNTLPSNLYTFFDHVKVAPYWEGFQLTYELKGLVGGSATVFFVGENPNTHALDTLTLENFQLESGTHVKAYSVDLSQRQPFYTVAITTEDTRQRIVKKEVYTGIVGIDREIFPNTNFELLDPFHKSKEMAYNSSSNYKPGAFGKGYLFDGDIKGTKASDYYTLGRATPPFTFYAGPNALHTPENDVYFVLDTKEPLMLGEMRFYAKYRDGYATNQDFGSSANSYDTKLPCAIKVYAWTASEPYDPGIDQSTIPAEKWKLMGAYTSDPSAQTIDRWYCNKEQKTIVTVKSLAELNPLEPLYASVSFAFDTNEYRYYKIEFEATYKDLSNPIYNHNNDNMVTCHEIEVYAKKE